MTSGLPDYQPIRGTELLYAADSDSLLFFHKTERRFYLLLSGRWFTSESLRGPWNYLSPHDLPSDFAKIPPSSPQAIVLASVPNTPQAELAVIANSVPTTATVNRRSAAGRAPDDFGWFPVELVEGAVGAVFDRVEEFLVEHLDQHSLAEFVRFPKGVLRAVDGGVHCA